MDPNEGVRFPKGASSKTLLGDLRREAAARTLNQLSRLANNEYKSSGGGDWGGSA